MPDRSPVCRPLGNGACRFATGLFVVDRCEGKNDGSANALALNFKRQKRFPELYGQDSRRDFRSRQSVELQDRVSGAQSSLLTDTVRQQADDLHRFMGRNIQEQSVHRQRRVRRTEKRDAVEMCPPRIDLTDRDHRGM